MGNYVYTRNGPHELEIDSAIVWDDQYGVSIEYPFFAIGKLVKCWVTDVIPADKTCKLKLINYDAGIFADDLPEVSE